MPPSFWDSEPRSVLRAAACFALFLGLLGFLPHALFMLNVGEWHYFAAAWDEDSYTRYALLHRDIIYRTISAGLLRNAIHLLGLDTALIVMDVVFPALLAAVAIYVVAALGLRRRRSLFLGACLLVFALEFLGLTNASMIGAYPTQALPFSSMVYPDWIRRFIPSAYENFFSVFRTPDPQISYLFQLLTLLMLVLHARSHRPRYLLGFLVLAAAFPFIYVSTGIALLVCVWLYGSTGWLLNRAPAYRHALLAALLASGYYLYAFFNGPRISTTDADGFVFFSRMPVVSFTMLWGALLVYSYCRHARHTLFTKAWRQQVDAVTVLAFACAALPWITLNQQVITGQMVQSRTWEYYTNPMFTAIALLVFWPWFAPLMKRYVPTCLSRLLPHLPAILVGWLVVSQVANFDKYLRGNLDNLAAAQLLTTLEQEGAFKNGQLMLENVGDDSQISLRMGRTDLMAIAGYQQTLMHMLPRLDAGEDAWRSAGKPIRDQAFAYFDRLSYTPEFLSAAMTDAAERSMGAIEVAYFFAYLDCWKPLSDAREQNVEGMKQHLPEIVAEYAAFRADDKRRNQFGTLYYVTRKLRTPVPEAAWTEVLVAEKTVGWYKPTTVRIYRQTPIMRGRKHQVRPS